MKKAKIVVCKNCGATFRNRRFWVIQKNDPVSRRRCVRCWSKGPFKDATKKDIEVFSKKLTHNLNLFGLFEIISGFIVIIGAIYFLFKY